MQKGNTKLPNVEVLRKHLEEGMNRSEIAALYRCRPDTVRQVLKRAGLVAEMREVQPSDRAVVNGKPATGDRKTGRRKMEFEDNRGVSTSNIAARQTAGAAMKRISLPFNSMHAAKLRD